VKNLFGTFILVAGLIFAGCGDDAGTDPADNSETSAEGTEGEGTEGEGTEGEGTEGEGTEGEGTEGEATLHVVSTEDGNMDFLPADIVIAVGDTVRFEMTATHNAVEVSQETYDERGFVALEGGFNIGFGETGEVTFDTAGVHYYICQPHVMIDMIGTITVE